YTVYSIASINSEGIPAHMESIWSKPLEIAILAENQTTPNTSPAISVTTNLQNYTAEDKIIISGHIANPNSKLPLVIKIFDSHHQEVISKLFPLWSNESYAWTVPPAAFYYSGNYTVLAQYGENYTTSHFILNFDIHQYLQSLSPLQQRKMFPGTLPQDFHCRGGFQLILKAEDFTPACVHPLAATKLIMWGWALGTTHPEPLIKNMSIVGLQQNYFAGQPINATVRYTGYEFGGIIPDVTILDSNGTQVWNNCCIVHSEDPQLAFSTFTYVVAGPAGSPVINKTGTYTMTVLLDNKTAQASFTVTNQRNQTLPASFEPCQDPYPQKYQGIPTLYMPLNSTGKICVRYHNLNDFPVRIGIGISEANNLTQSAKDVSAWNDSGNNTISAGDSTIVYWIKTGNHKGLYGLTIFCVPMPFAVGYENSTLKQNDFPWLENNNQWFCPAEPYDFHIDSTAGFKVGYIPVK
ncbi:MAG: hypothetical protein KGI08_09940, partial [Thaumarchaeota archaeon]|nr:hypothetical protein [Nitrososphaerota archaeon]